MKKILSLSHLILYSLFLSLGSATQYFDGEPVSVLDGDSAKPWMKVEHHKDAHPRFPSEPFHPKLVQFYPQIKEAFQTAEPHSSEFLLHFAPNALNNDGTIVLLIPGANDDATRRYARPLSTHDENHLTSPGLMQYLDSKNYRVFAVTFSHYHGDNLYQAEHVANSIQRIQQVLNTQEAVSLVTYSKGAMAARLYLQSGGDLFGKTFLTSYRGDVRSVVFQGGPILGLDTPFRYYLYNLTLMSEKIPAPLGVKSMVIYGSWKDAGIGSIFSGYWPGQLQMIHDLRNHGIPHGVLSFTTDANLSAVKLVNGGSSFFLQSHGLEKARVAGGRMIEALNSIGLPEGVGFALLAGNFPIIYDERYPGWKIPAGAELTAASDGLVFVKSATFKEGLNAQGAQHLGTKVLSLNHIQLSRDKKAYEFVDQMLED